MDSHACHVTRAAIAGSSYFTTRHTHGRRRVQPSHTMNGALVYLARSAASLAEVPAILAVLLETAWKLLARKRILGVLSDQLARRSTVRCEPTTCFKEPASLPLPATWRWRRAQSMVQVDASFLLAPHSA